MDEDTQHKIVGLLTMARGWLELGLMPDHAAEIKDCMNRAIDAVDKLTALLRAKGEI